MSTYLKNISDIFIKFLLFYGLLILIDETKIIKLDNLINEPLYQNNIDYSEFHSKNKFIAIYYPEDNKNNSLNIENDFNFNKSLIEQHVNYAKSHGLYGFGIIYNLINNKNINNTFLDICSNLNNLNYPFFIILKYDLDYEQLNQSSLTD